jgi:hypothetical protein
MPLPLTVALIAIIVMLLVITIGYIIDATEEQHERKRD